MVRLVQELFKTQSYTEYMFEDNLIFETKEIMEEKVNHSCMK